MNCQRCQKDFPEAELKLPSVFLRVLAAPYFLMLMFLALASDFLFPRLVPRAPPPP